MACRSYIIVNFVCSENLVSSKNFDQFQWELVAESSIYNFQKFERILSKSVSCCLEEKSLVPFCFYLLARCTIFLLSLLIVFWSWKVFDSTLLVNLIFNINIKFKYSTVCCSWVCNLFLSLGQNLNLIGLFFQTDGWTLSIPGASMANP